MRKILIETVLEKITCDRCGKTDQGKFERHLRKPSKVLKFMDRLFGGIMVLIWDYTQPQGWVRYGDLDFCPNCAKQFEDKMLNFFKKP